MVESGGDKSTLNEKEGNKHQSIHKSSHNHKDNTLRNRRTKSVTRAEEITTKEQKQRKSQPDKPWVKIKQKYKIL